MTFLKKQHHSYKKKYHINVDQFWVYFVCVVLVVLLAQIVFSMYLFSRTISYLDAPVLPKLQTNSSEIKSIEKNVSLIEEAITKRTGDIEVSPREESNLE